MKYRKALAAAPAPLRYARLQASKQNHVTLPPSLDHTQLPMAAIGDDDDGGHLSLRTTLNERKTMSATDVRKKSLFRLVDTDHSGTIDQAEFGELYDVVREQTEKELMAKVTAQKSAVASKRKVKLLGCSLGVMMLFLGLSVAANFVVTLTLLEATKEMHTSESGILVQAKNASIPITVKNPTITSGNPMDASFETFLANNKSTRTTLAPQSILLDQETGTPMAVTPNSQHRSSHRPYSCRERALPKLLNHFNSLGSRCWQR